MSEPIAQALLEILACPSNDHAPLQLASGPDGDVLVCTVCRSAYPIRDGIPVLLLDEATPGPLGVGVPAPPSLSEAGE